MNQCKIINIEFNEGINDNILICKQRFIERHLVNNQCGKALNIVMNFAAVL